MTCAACVGRVEKSLRRIPGVEATVNLATERARVRVPPGVGIPEIVDAVEAAGYAATPRPAAHGAPEGHDGGRAGPDHPAHHHLAPGHGAHDHGAHDHGALVAATQVRRLRDRLIVAIALAAPVVLIAMVPPLQFPYWQWVALALALPVVTWGAWPFHRGAWSEVRHASLGMDSLVSLGVITAFGWSIVALAVNGETYLEVAVAVTSLILLGRWIEARAKREAGGALRALAELGAKEAARVRGGREELVPVGALVAGDLVRVRPGERIPSDGVVREGTSALDASAFTGESVPVEVAPGARVAGGMLNASGALLVEIERVGADTELARITRLVEDAQTEKSSAQRLADRISAVFVPIVIAVAVLALAGWLLASQPIDAALTAAIATLIIACPCALGLATPVAILVGTTRGSQLGILISGPEALERTRRITAVLLDKTGTLTVGRMRVTDVVPIGGDEAPLLRLAAAAEQGSEHPIARAIVERAADAGAIPAPERFDAAAGLGVRARVEGRELAVGRAAWIAEELGEAPPPPAAAAVERIEASGGTAVLVAADRVVLGVLGVADEVKPASPGAVAALRALGIEPVLLTGDNAGAARAVAAAVGIDDVRAGMTPQGKVETVRALRAEGRAVAMVGDGINDAAALAAADLGIAMGGGTDAAIAAADITIVGGDPGRIADAVRLSRRTLGVIRGNLFWAFAYNVAAIPLAVAGLLNPMIAAAAMAFSSVFVVLNSLRLRRFR